MRSTFILIVLLPVLLFARENPFTPVEIIKTESIEEKSLDDKAVAPVEQELTAEPVVNKVESREPAAVIEPKRNSMKEVANYAKARFVFRENSAYIETKDRIIKHFSIANPPSIVIDFRSEASDFASKRRELATPPFKKLEMGAHGDRYRVVLRLDKRHTYKLEKRKYGQLVTITK